MIKAFLSYFSRTADTPSPIQQPPFIVEDEWADTKPKKVDYVWPDCAPPAPGEIGGGYSDGYTQYHKKEVSHGHWQWVVNEEAMEMLRKYEQRKEDLRWALISRVLSDEEMTTVQQYGHSLFVRNMEPYMEDEKRRIFNDALAQQFRLRAIAAQYKSE